MLNLRRSAVLLLVSLFCVVFAAGCDDIISDPNFHTWCGDQLCSWKLESGEIRKVPTWHKKDFGVELLDSKAPSHVTAISQKVVTAPSLFNIFSSPAPTCLEFSVIADVAAEAQVSISVDFSADGEVEYEQPIAATGFREQKTQITAPLQYENITFTISKRGTGRAVLAQMDVRSKTDCTAPPLRLKPQKMGSKCGSDRSACLSGVCCDGMCSECCPSRPPEHDEDGGVVPDLQNMCTGATCESLRLPNTPEGLPSSYNAIPRQCEPGSRKRPAGAECLLDEDCTSGTCSDADWTLYKLHIDGGACPPPPAGDANCLATSVRAGRCR